VLHRHRFETLQRASRIIGDGIGFYKDQQLNQALGMQAPAEVYALAASPVQKSLGEYIKKQFIN
jgi:putative transposase